MALPNGLRSSSPSSNDSPWRQATDSPSWQLLRELGLQNDANARAFHAKLDADTLRLEKEHRLALAAATLEHERVRKSAERAHERVEIQLQWQRHTEEEKEKQALERERQELVHRKIANQQREFEEAERLKRLKQDAVEVQERARRAREEAASIPEPVPQLEAEEVQPSRHKNDKESVTGPGALPALTNGSLKSDNDISHSKSTNQTVPEPFPNAEKSKPHFTTTAPSPGIQQAHLPSLARSKHLQYLEVHQRLKQLRKSVDEMQDKQLKKQTGEYRREIKKSVGQLTVDMKANTTPYNRIRDILNLAANLQQPQIDIRSYLVSNLPPNAGTLPCTAGLVQTYLLNIFSKAVVSQFVNEAGVAPKAAEPIGTVAIRIFAAPDLKWQGVSLIDILIAKFHAICPILFGVYGRSPATKKQKRGESLSGLGAGFGALSLRDFGKSTMQNPFPPTNYWQSLACILNTPAKETTQEHFIVLKAMIEHHATRFIRFYGQAAIVALRKAIVDFPQQSSNGVASSALSTLKVTLQRDLHLTL